MNRRTRKRAFSMPLDDVSCMALNDSGGIVCQNMGGPTANFGDGPIFVYQKGLLAPKSIKRTHRNRLSNFKITTPGGSAHVPWSHFAWIPSRETRVIEGSGEDLVECVNMFQTLTSQNIFVVWVHGDYGERIFEWYVAFRANIDGNAMVLTRVPHHFFHEVINNSGSSFCKSGQSEHPLLSMTNTCSTHSASIFESRAVNYFQEYSKLVHCHRNQSKKAKVKEDKPKSSLTEFEEGTCAICLEDTEVSSSACSHNLCKLQVCVNCHVKTRGLCAVCDRSKNSCAFLCMTCDKLCDMDDFGYQCLRCEKPSLCGTCFENFEFCVQCACDIASSRSCVKIE